MQSPDFTQRNIEQIAALFPHVIVEGYDDAGKVRRKVDFDALRQELSEDVVEGPQERFRLDWPGKREAQFTANTPISKTLRPVREESVDFDTTQNLFIEGDNLEVLKLLQESYLGKVKLIYIDPPYNTGRDFIYNDDYAESEAEHREAAGATDEEGRLLEANYRENSRANGRFHSDWLSMMYPRLKLARNLLKDDGVIFISIDDNEVDNLRRIASEIFGDQNFIAQIIWQKVYAPKNSARWFSEDHDYVLVYARDRAQWQPRSLPRTAEMEARYKNPDSDPRGPWKAADMTARNPYDAGIYPVTSPSGRVIEGPPRGRYWAISEERFKALDADNRIWWGPDGNNTPAVKRFLSEVAAGRTPQTLWKYNEVGHTQDAKKALLKYVPFEHTENVLNSVKPVELIQRIIQLSSAPEDKDIVLDFFGGSATTAHAVLKQNLEDGGNRRFISVTINEPLKKAEPTFDSIFGMGLTRVKNVAAEYAESVEVPEHFDWGFRVARTDTSNLNDVSRHPDALDQEELDIFTDNIKQDRTAEDLLFQVMLDWGLELSLPISAETLEGKEVFSVDNGAVIACFDDEISMDLIRAVARRQPLRAVFQDAAFVDDSARINTEQIFTELSPQTVVKVM